MAQGAHWGRPVAAAPCTPGLRPATSPLRGAFDLSLQVSGRAEAASLQNTALSPHPCGLPRPSGNVSAMLRPPASAVSATMVNKLTAGRTNPRSGKRSATRQNSGHPLASPHPVFSVDQRFAIEKALDHTLRHKRRPIGHMGDDVGIVAHQQIGHAVLLFQAVKQIENFRLH